MPKFLGFGNGSDGDLVISSNTTESPTDSICSGTVGTNTLTVDSSVGFSSNQIVLVHQTRADNSAATPGVWELGQVDTYVGTTLTLRDNLENTYVTGGSINRAQVRVVPQYSSVQINSGVTYSPALWDGNKRGLLAFMCSGLVNNEGTMSANACGFRGGSPGADDSAFCGEGSEYPASVNVQNPAGNGGGSYHISSSGGGNASTVTGGEGTEGTEAGNAALTILLFGGGGGASGENSSSGEGGDGGGIIVMFARTVVNSVAAQITSSGENGANASRGGSGGAGGSILIKALTGTLNTALAAINGTKGSSAVSNSDGSMGRIHLDICTITDVGTYTSSPTADVVAGGLSWCLVPGQVI